LNHPNIAAIYGLEDGDGIKALVMELTGAYLRGPGELGEPSVLFVDWLY
jgi:hypothetical protein